MCGHTWWGPVSNSTTARHQHRCVIPGRGHGHMQAHRCECGATKQ